MTAAGEGYQYAMVNPGADPESMRMFPIWVGEAAYMNSDELGILTSGSNDVSMAPPTSNPGARAQQRTRSNMPSPTRGDGPAPPSNPFGELA